MAILEIKIRHNKNLANNLFGGSQSGGRNYGKGSNINNGRVKYLKTCSKKNCSQCDYYHQDRPNSIRNFITKDIDIFMGRSSLEIDLISFNNKTDEFKKKYIEVLSNKVMHDILILCMLKNIYNDLN